MKAKTKRYRLYGKEKHFVADLSSTVDLKPAYSCEPTITVIDGVEEEFEGGLHVGTRDCVDKYRFRVILELHESNGYFSNANVFFELCQ